VAAASPTVLVTVGTDHHPFDRLVRWVDVWARRNPDARVLVQHGTAAPPTVAEGRTLLPADEFRRAIDRADAVVCAGGPGAIMETRAAGLRPIVVPRRAALGEHVDDHQRAFAMFMAARGAITLADDEVALLAALDAVAADRDAFRVPPEDGGAEGIARIGALIDDLVLGGPR
jgi:UDP-N-acetylglucosamine transferase subunit ALG13